MQYYIITEFVGRPAEGQGVEGPLSSREVLQYVRATRTPGLRPNPVRVVAVLPMEDPEPLGRVVQ